MGSWRKMGAFLGLMPEEHAAADDGYGEQYHAEQYQDEGYQRSYPAEGYGYAGRSARSAATDRGYADAPTHGALAVAPAPEYPVETGTGQRPYQVKLTGFAEARIIGERYREGGSVILDMTELSDADARRVVDFAAGLAFALHGSIDKVTTKVFMLHPPALEEGTGY